MIPHPLFLNRIVDDRRQALIEHADTHRLLRSQHSPSKQRRRLALRLRLTRRIEEPRPGRADVQPTAPTPLPVVASGHVMVAATRSHWSNGSPLGRREHP